MTGPLMDLLAMVIGSLIANDRQSASALVRQLTPDELNTFYRRLDEARSIAAYVLQERGTPIA